MQILPENVKIWTWIYTPVEGLHPRHTPSGRYVSADLRLCRYYLHMDQISKNKLHQNWRAVGSIPARDLQLHFSQLFLVRLV
jgi:hypothetical protein